MSDPVTAETSFLIFDKETGALVGQTPWEPAPCVAGAGAVTVQAPRAGHMLLKAHMNGSASIECDPVMVAYGDSVSMQIDAHAAPASSGDATP